MALSARPMPLSDAEKKRRSRASKPRAYHDREREMSRKRMAICRARNRAQKRASQLRSLLNDKDKQAFQARTAEEKQRLVCEWFAKKHLRFDPKVINDKKILNVFMTKLDLYKIELQVAEFEISLMGIEEIKDDAEGGNVASHLDKAKSFTMDKGEETSTAESRKIISSGNSSERNLNTQIDPFLEKEMPSSDLRGKEVREVLEAKRQEVARPGPSSDICGKEVGGMLDAKKEEVTEPTQLDRLLEEEMEEVRGILGVKQEEVAEPGYSVTNGGGLSERKENEVLAAISEAKQEEITQLGYPDTDDRGEFQRWDDEVLAAEAMAIMQTSQGGKTNSL